MREAGVGGSCRQVAWAPLTVTRTKSSSSNPHISTLQPSSRFHPPALGQIGLKTGRIRWEGSMVSGQLLRHSVMASLSCHAMPCHAMPATAAKLPVRKWRVLLLRFHISAKLVIALLNYSLKIL